MNTNNATGTKDGLKKNLRQYTMIIILVALAIVFAILTHGTFISSKNISNLFLQCSAVAIVAIGVSMVLIAGHMDLSIGSCVGLTGAVAATLMVNHGWATVPTILVTLLVGILIGCWQGYWTAFRGVPSFIVTLAGQMVFRGIVLGITKGMTIAPMNDSFKVIGQGYLPTLGNDSFNILTMILAVVICIVYVIMELRKNAARKKNGLDPTGSKGNLVKVVVICVVILAISLVLAMNRGVSYALILVIIVAVIFNFISNNTPFGKYIYAIGGNKEAARLSGINIKKITFIIFVVMGFLTAISGIIFTARQNAGTAAAGTSMEMDAISAAVIGGTSTMGGEGSIFGALIGALIMTSIDNGMSLMNLDNTYQYIVKGMVLLLAVWMDVATNKKSAS